MNHGHRAPKAPRKYLGLGLRKRRRNVERILVIYDDPRSQWTVSRILGQANYDVITVAYGSFTLDVFRATKPRLVVLDVCLPMRSGQDLCRRIRNESGNIPLFVLSATKDVAVVVLLLDLGADDYITKPFSPSEFMARVRGAMRSSALFEITNG
jgi:DNA-binding response OmpR family regulator